MAIFGRCVQSVFGHCVHAIFGHCLHCFHACLMRKSRSRFFFALLSSFLRRFHMVSLFLPAEGARASNANDGLNIGNRHSYFRSLLVLRITYMLVACYLLLIVFRCGYRISVRGYVCRSLHSTHSMHVYCLSIH